LEQARPGGPEKPGAYRTWEETLRNLVPLTLLVVGFLATQQAQAQQEVLAVEQRCPGVAVDVTTASDDERRLVCSAAATAVQLVGRCGIALRQPLQVEVASEVHHPLRHGVILGFFDTKRERVLVTQEANVPALVKGTPYAALPQRDFYKSLIVHEVVHAVMHQNLKRPAATHAAHEYPAYALQIESLAANVRDTFLKTFDQSAVKADATPFTDLILFFDPYVFAARAYQHFKASPDGCAHLRALLAGEAPFIATLP
jgi:uncharacterized protein DUF6639